MSRYWSLEICSDTKQTKNLTCEVQLCPDKHIANIATWFSEAIKIYGFMFIQWKVRYTIYNNCLDLPQNNCCKNQWQDSVNHRLIVLVTPSCDLLCCPVVAVGWHTGHTTHTIKDGSSPIRLSAISVSSYALRRSSVSHPATSTAKTSLSRRSVFANISVIRLLFTPVSWAVISWVWFGCRQHGTTWQLYFEY